MKFHKIGQTGAGFGVKTSRSALMLAAAGLVAASAEVGGADQTWGANANTQWYVAGNWAGGSGYPGLAGGAASNGDVATFSGDFTGTEPGIDMGAGSLNLGAVVVTNARTTATSIGNSGALAGSLRLYGATVNSVPNVILRNAGTGLLTLDGSRGAGMGVELGNATDHVVSLDGAGGIRISAPITELVTGAKLTLAGSGAGTLTLAAPSLHTGTTTIGAGRLALAVDQALPTSAYVLFQSPAGAATSRTLDIGSTTQEIGRLNLSYNPNGAVTHTATVAGNNGSLKVSGAFDLNVTNSSSVTPGATASVVNLDMSGLTTFEYAGASNKVVVFGNGNARAAAVSFGAGSTLTANAVELQNGGAGGNTAKTSTINLGASNVWNVDTISVLQNNVRDSATLKFRALASPSFKVRAKDGVGRAAWNIGTAIGANSATGTALVDLTSGVTGASSLDAQVSTLQIGNKSGTGTLNASFLMGGGTLDATSIQVGSLTGAGTLNATFSVTSGRVKAGTLTLGTRTAGTLQSTFTLGGGTLAAGAVTGSGTATRVFQWNDGTLTHLDGATDLTVGSAVPLSLSSTGTHRVLAEAGRTVTIASPVIDLTSGGGLLKEGDGALILQGQNTYTGNTVVSAGSLELASGAKMKFVLGSTSGVSNQLSGSGLAVIDGAFEIDLSATTALSSGSWQLENVDGLPGSYGGNFQVVGFTDAGGDQWVKQDGAKHWTFDETTGTLTLALVAQNLSWNGTVDGVWDVAGTSNWLNGAASSSYALGDYARFDDLASGTTSITLNDLVQPAAVTFDHSLKQYSLSGSGQIAGFGSLTKAGSGQLTVLTNNTYSGTTTIQGGTVMVGNGGTTGSLGTGAIANDATLIFSRSDELVVGSAISGAGTIQQMGTGTLVLTADSSFSGNLEVFSGVVQFGNGGASGSMGSLSSIQNEGMIAFARSGSTTLSHNILGGGGLRQAGPGTLVVTTNQGYTGSTEIRGGTLQLGNGGEAGDLASLLIENDGTLVIQRSGDLNFFPMVSGTGDLVYAGSGSLRLSGGNTYSGRTIVGGTGTLVLDALGSALPAGTGLGFTASGNVDVNGSDLVLSSLTKGAGVTSAVQFDSGYGLSVEGGQVLVNEGTLNLSSASLFTHVASGGNFDVFSASSGGTAAVLLSKETNLITTNLFAIGRNGSSGAGTTSSATVTLGLTNTIHSNEIVVGSNGAQSGTSTLTLDPAQTNATVEIRGAGGEDTRANLTIGSKSNSDYAGGFGIVNFATSGATVDALLNQVVIGRHDTGAGNFNNPTGGTLLMGAGVLDASAITMAVASAPAIKTADGTLTVTGGTVKVGTLTMVQDGGGALGQATVNLNGGAVLEATTVSGQVATNALIQWNQGTIRNLAGTDLTVSGVTLNVPASGSAAMAIEGGRTATLGNGTVLKYTFNSSAEVPAVTTVTLSGSLELEGASLSVVDAATESTVLPGGTKLVLLGHGGALTGTFAGLAEGSTLTVGANTFVVSYQDAGAVTLTVGAGSPYAIWAESYGLDPQQPNGEESGDYDGDGQSNLIEFVTGSHPANGGSRGVTEVVKSGNQMEFTFVRLKAAVEAGYVTGVEYSTSLDGTWTRATAPMFGVPVDLGDRERITVSLPIPGGTSRFFARLVVE